MKIVDTFETENVYLVFIIIFLILSNSKIKEFYSSLKIKSLNSLFFKFGNKSFGLSEIYLLKTSLYSDFIFNSSN